LIQIGPRVFSVIITNVYTEWKDFLMDIDFGLAKLQESQVVSKVSRFALRYINYFDGNILTKSNLSIRLNDLTLNASKSQFRIEIPDGEFINTLMINSNALIQREGGIRVGSIIDIDTYVEKELPDFFNDRGQLLEDCHSTEKKLFSSLLSEEYVKTLNEIKYV